MQDQGVEHRLVVNRVWGAQFVSGFPDVAIVSWI